MHLLLAISLFLAYFDRQYLNLVQAYRGDHSQATFLASHEWSFGEKPSENSTSQLIFESVGSFLQRWPNLRYQNGHNIVPGIVEAGTLLYHGTTVNVTPKTEWVAFDPERSFLSCRGIEENDNACWMLTLVTTRPLKMLYFDGSSAAKVGSGVMDAQDTIAWGKIMPERARGEFEPERIRTLCDWGKQFEPDGFIRMSTSFEMMLCDFTAGVETVSFLHINEHDYEGRRFNKIASAETVLRLFEAGGWNDYYPIKVDYERCISFYDTSLFPSLQDVRFGHGRLDHRLLGISQTDIQHLHTRLTEVLQAGMGPAKRLGSGVDWKAIIKVIKNRYSDRLEVLHYILNSTSELIPEDRLKRANRHITSMISPYILHSGVPGDTLSSVEPHLWAAPVFELCATTHTNYLQSANILSLTPSEHVLLSSVQGVIKEICRILVEIWAEGVETFHVPPKEIPHVDFEYLIKEWRLRVEDLMEWLDWSSWVQCRPACSFEELCYLPAFPFISLNETYPGLPRKKMDNFGSETDEDGSDPQPRCLRRVAPII